MLYVDSNTRDRIRSLHFQAEERAHRRAEARARRRLQSLSAGRLQVLADRAARILDAGEPTKFEYEGACRQGFRSALVIEGWKWADADAAAAVIISTALHQIGAERPTWLEGQPETAANQKASNYYCAGCAKPIPEERRHMNYGVKYCSNECGRAAYQRHARSWGLRVSLAEHLARCAQKSEQTLRERSGDCERCNRPFISSLRDARFCSRACSSASRRKRIDKPCEQCGSMFSAGWSKRQGEQRYCSSACHTAAGRGLKARERPEIVCKACSTIFRPPASKTRLYCSPACNPRAPKAQRANFRCEETI